MIFLGGGWEVEWRPYPLVYPIAGWCAGAHSWHGARVHKKMPDGSWKGFRGAGITY